MRSNLGLARMELLIPVSAKLSDLTCAEYAKRIPKEPQASLTHKNGSRTHSYRYAPEHHYNIVSPFLCFSTCNVSPSNTRIPIHQPRPTNIFISLIDDIFHDIVNLVLMMDLVCQLHS